MLTGVILLTLLATGTITHERSSYNTEDVGIKACKPQNLNLTHSLLNLMAGVETSIFLCLCME